MATDIHIEGLQELKEKLERMPEQFGKKIIGDVLRKQADMVRDAFAAAAPQDTGFLAEHFDVKMRTSKENIEGYAYVGPAGRRNYPFRGRMFKFLKKKFGRTVTVATVARYLEFGTSKMPARPFLRPTWERLTGDIIDGIVKGTRELIAELSDK